MAFQNFLYLAIIVIALISSSLDGFPTKSNTDEATTHAERKQRDAGHPGNHSDVISENDVVDSRRHEASNNLFLQVLLEIHDENNKNSLKLNGKSRSNPGNAGYIEVQQEKREKDKKREKSHYQVFRADMNKVDIRLRTSLRIRIGSVRWLGSYIK